MKALIDSDIFQHEYGNATDSEFKPLGWPLIVARVNARIAGIMEATGADSYQLYVTSEDKSNFRFDVATIVPYKGHRDSEKPFWYTHIRNFIVDFRGGEEIFGMEADDAMSIEQRRSAPESTIICSRDKDLHIVPGWHYGWACGKQKEQKPWFQSEIGGLRCFYGQLLTGDSTDNILGLFGVGKASAHVTALKKMDTEIEMYDHVFTQYEKRFGSYAEQFLIENARLLWMLREEGELWTPPANEIQK